MSIPTLRPYQHDCLAAIVEARGRGLTRVLVQAATGVGKSEIFCSLPTVLAPWLQTFPKGDRRVLVIAHREELIGQAANRMHKLNPDLSITVEQADQYASRYSDVVVASIQTLTALKCRRLKRLLGQMTFRIVVYDEAHHSSSPSARTALVHLGFLPPADASDSESLDAPSYEDVSVMEDALASWDQTGPQDRLLVGFTATPNRSDGVGLGAVFQEIVYSYPIRKAVQDGWLVNLVPYVVDTSTSLDDVKTTAGDFNQKQLAFTVNTPARNNLAVKGWQQYAKDRPTLAFTVDVQHAHDLAETFRVVGVRATALSGETPKDERALMLRQYTEGQIDVITNCQVLTEGTDLPRTACILNAKPTKSASLLEQMVGRGLRLFPPDKKECVIIDVVDILRKHSLQTTPTLFGLPPGLTGKGETLDALADEWDDLLAQYPALAGAVEGRRLTIDQLRVQAKTFDIWSVPSLGDFGKSVVLNWIKTAADIFQLRYPWGDDTEILQVSPDLLGKWEVSCTLRSRDKGPVRQRTIAHGIVEQSAAAALAEAFIQQQRSNVVKLKERSAPWREKPASEKQLALLAKFKIPHNPKAISCGAASDLLDLKFSRSKGGRR